MVKKSQMKTYYLFLLCEISVSSPMIAKRNVSTLEAIVKQANRYIDTPKKSM